jgi:hypothetical protein
MKTCQNCENGRITQSLKALAEKEKTTPERLNVRYCLLNGNFKSLADGCDKFKLKEK